MKHYSQILSTLILLSSSLLFINITHACQFHADGEHDNELTSWLNLSTTQNISPSANQRNIISSHKKASAKSNKNDGVATSIQQWLSDVVN